MLKRYILLLACAVYITAAIHVATYTFKTIGDLKIDLDVYTPSATPPTDGYPVFFAIHGGAYVGGSKKEAFSIQEFTEVMNRGWVLVSVNYRLLPGAFLQDMLEDTQDAYQWVRTELIKTTPINVDLITVFGQSAGGGLAVLSGYKFSPRPRAVIAFYSACTNWTEPAFYRPETPVNPLFAAAANKLAIPVVTEYNMTNRSEPKMILWDAVNNSSKIGWLVTTHDPNFPTEGILANLKALSAAENVDENYPPTYLAHGLVDVVVNYTQSVLLANQLRKFNIQYVLDLVPDADHGFDYYPNFWEQHVLPAFNFAQQYMQENSTNHGIQFLEK